MKKTKHYLIFLFGLLLLTNFICGCKKNENKNPKSDTKKTVTVTTSFIKDMVKNLANDKVNLNLIIPEGDDPHLYVAKPEDLEKIKSADLVLYQGIHFEGKMQKFLEDKGVALSEDFNEEDIIKIEENGISVEDPHFWFDINLYKKAFLKCKDELLKIIPNEKESLEKNYDSYLKELGNLDSYIKDKISEIPEDQRYLITPHDAFNYFSRAYKMTVIAPQGVSTESEASGKDIDKTVDFIVEHKIKAIFAESTTNPEKMEKLKENCKMKGFDVKVVSGEGNELFSDSLAPEGKDGDTYITMYKHNIDLIVNNLK